MNLLEQYKGRLAVSESMYKNRFGGEMPESRKLMIATCLNNTNAFLTEAFEKSEATQRANMGDFKKFCLNLNTVALPNLIANDLVIVQPMTSITGVIAYVKYTASVTKGATVQGDVFNDPFRLGKVDPTYTSERVVETAGKPDDEGFVELAWTPVRKAEAFNGTDWVECTVVDGKKINVAEGTKVRYIYDNEVVPQDKIPGIEAHMESMPLFAHARRIAIRYSAIAAFQAKNDYGFDLGDQLAEKAVGQLSYEIDTEVTDLLIANAKEDAELTWSKTLPLGVGKLDHYTGFAEIVEIGRQKIYDATKRFAPNYMLIASNVLPVLSFLPGFTPASAGQINGPYLAGTLNSLKVYVTPNITPGKFVLGVNGDDMASSAAVYAPYMPIVPSQLLEFADGLNSQGWATMYDLRMLNEDLLVAGKVIA